MTDGAQAPGPVQPDDPGPGAEGLDLARATARSVAAAARQVPGPGGRAGAGGRRRTLPTSRSATPRSGPLLPSMSGAHPDDRDPQPLGSVMGRLVDDHGWELDLRVHGLFGRWPELVGRDVAEHCAPESFADGRLVVRSDSTAWATQLRLLAATLVRRLNEELGHGVVTLIEVRGPQGPSWKKGRRSVRGGRGPRDTYG